MYVVLCIISVSHASPAADGEQRCVSYKVTMHTYTIDDKNIDFRIKKHKKHVFFTFIKKHLKNMHKKH